jgi:hypothetical protein
VGEGEVRRRGGTLRVRGGATLRVRWGRNPTGEVGRRWERNPTGELVGEEQLLATREKRNWGGGRKGRF